jgi:hypothetical protein
VAPSVNTYQTVSTYQAPTYQTPTYVAPVYQAPAVQNYQVINRPAEITTISSKPIRTEAPVLQAEPKVHTPVV